MMKEAMLYENLEENRVACHLCGHQCKIEPSRCGICGVRKNIDGTLYSLVYGKIIVQNVDPIEKKPLFDVLPGSKSFSIAAPGCNFRCRFCQNHEISQLPRETGTILGQPLSPDEIVKMALESGARSIAYTYTEPTIFFVYAYDSDALARKNGLLNIFVSNGFMSEEAVEKIAPYLDAANVDLKSFSDEFYRKQCGARL